MTTNATPRESARALEAWTVYRDLGPGRSLDRAARECTKSVSLLRRWSAAHHWAERAIEHDQAIAAETARRDREDRVADNAKRRADRLAVASALRLKAAGALRKLTDEQLLARPATMIRMFQAADMAERLDTGEPTERNEITGPDGAPLLDNVIIYLPQKDEPLTPRPPATQQ